MPGTGRKRDRYPHTHILLTMRAMDETGKWLPKSQKVYDLDENSERIRLLFGSWKSHKEDTVDWNDSNDRSNSSLPPSSDKPGKQSNTYNGREKSRRSAKGQKGHKGKTLTKEAAEQK